MKLLTWMHRKLRQNSHETHKEFPHGETILNSHHYPKSYNSSGTWGQLQKNNVAQKSFTILQATRPQDLDMEPTDDLPESFHGFLTIGTLGGDTIISEPETPTFTYSVENIAERGTEVTENELKLVNDELEKVLGAEAKEDAWTDSSRRNSHVSNGRSSHASTITLSGKTLEIPASNGSEKIICPLQEYLLGAALELPEKTIVTKKEHRTSLGELFQKHKAEENSGSKSDKGEKQTDKNGDKTAINLMRKILRKKVIHAPSRSSPLGNGGTIESTSAETKLHKILHGFHKKVHPEGSTSAQRLHTQHKYGIRNTGHSSRGHVLQDEEITTASQGQGTTRKRYMHHYKSESNPTQFSDCGDDSNGSRECWITTDADYLVLEL